MPCFYAYHSPSLCFCNQLNNFYYFLDCYVWLLSGFIFPYAKMLFDESIGGKNSSPC